MSHLEGQVDALASGYGDGDVPGFGWRKSRRGGLDVVYAYTERRNLIVAGSARDDLDDVAGVYIGYGDGSVSYYRAGGVMDGANKAAILILRSRRDASVCDHEANEEKGSKEVK